MRNLYNYVDDTINKIAQQLFNKKYEDLTFAQTRKVHKLLLMKL